MAMQQDQRGANDDQTAAMARRVGEIDERVRTLERWAATVEARQRQAEALPRGPVVPGAARTLPPRAPVAHADSPPPSPARPVVGTPRATVPPASAGIPRPAAMPRLTGPVVRPRPATRWSLGDLDQLLSGRGLAWLGGLALILGAVFFLGLAFTRGWIGPPLRVGIGLAAGIALVGGGAWRFAKREALFGHVLIATGLGILALALVAATRLYALVPVEIGLLGALLVALAAATIAIRADTQLVAGYGLVTALAAPPLLGASPNVATIAFLATALAGTTAIALYRTWAWLPPVAFLLAAPQLANWLFGGARAPFAPALAALVGFWLLNALAAGGEEFRVRHDRLRPTSATVLLANVAFLVGAGFGHLARHDADGARGFFLVLVAIGHGLIGGYFLFADGERHPFGLLACGTGLAAFSVAIPVQLGGPVVPIAWAAEATALAWVYQRRRHAYSGGAALLLGGFAIGHLLTIEYPLWRLADDNARPNPFFHAQGGTLGFLLVALALTGLLLRAWPQRAALAGLGFVLVLYTLPFELSGLALLACFALIFLVAVVVRRFLSQRLSRGEIATLAPVGSAGGPWLSGTVVPAFGHEVVRLALALPTLLAATLTLAHALLFELPPRSIGALPATPFTDTATFAAGILIVTGLLAGELAGQRLARTIGRLAAVGTMAYLLPFELRSASMVVGWAALALALGALAAWDREGEPLILVAGAALVALGFVVALALVAPPERLLVDAHTTLRHPPLWSGATAALGALAFALAAASWRYRARSWARPLIFVLGATLVYLLSVGVVDEFQGRVGGAVAFATLWKGAQVALSILWAGLGGAAFVGGAWRRLTPLRLGGLALLVLATVKVFLVDLASLDATYRVPSFIVLGLFLLASSYVYQRLRPQPRSHEAR